MTNSKVKRHDESTTANGKPLSEDTRKADRSESNDTTITPADEKTQADQNNDERQPFDFGGLPNRNLKKNLGCG